MIGRTDFDSSRSHQWDGDGSEGGTVNGNCNSSRSQKKEEEITLWKGVS
jgi:hypothetical protein